MLEIPFNSVRRWQLVVVKCLAATTMTTTAAASGEQQPKQRQFGRFLVPTASVESEGDKIAKHQSTPSAGEQQQPSPQPSPQPQPPVDVDYAVMIKGAPEVILR